MWITWAAGALAVVMGTWPVADPTVVARFDPPVAAWSSGHRGVDLAARTGDVVRSMAAGTVLFAGTIAGKPVVSVGYPGPDRPRSTYEPVIPSVAVGQQVAEGAVLGTVAVIGGHCGGTRGCLHVGLRTDTRYLDPLTLVGRAPAVLKPPGTAVRRPPAAVGRLSPDPPRPEDGPG